MPKYTDMLGRVITPGCKVVYPLVTGSNTYLAHAEVIEVIPKSNRTTMWDGHPTAEDKRFHIKVKLLNYSDPHNRRIGDKEKTLHLQKPERVVIVG